MARAYEETKMAWTSVENDGGLMAEGDYEVICLKAKEGETQGGTPVIDFEFQVRTDIEQKYGRKHIFKSFFRDRKTGEWPADRIGKYANALGVPKGEQFELNDLVGKCCIVHMRPYKSNDGTMRDSVAWVAKTKAGEIGEVQQPAPAGGGFVEVPEEELPF